MNKKITNHQITALTNLALALSVALHASTDKDTRAVLDAMNQSLCDLLKRIRAEMKGK